LGKRYLVRRNSTDSKIYFSIHRTLQRSILHRLDEDPTTRQATFEVACSIVRQAIPRPSSVQAPSNDTWEAVETCLGHVLHLEEVYRNSPAGLRASKEFGGLLTDVGNYMWERGFYYEGIRTLESAEKIYEESNESERQHLLEKSKVPTLLAGIHLELGIRGRKRGLDYTVKSWNLRQKHEKAYASDGEELPDDDLLLLANSYNDIGCCMLEYGCYDRVEEALGMSIELKKSRSIPEEGHAVFNYAENYKNLAILRTAQGKHTDAIELSMRAARMIAGEYGSQNPAAQAFHMHLANALYQAGRFGEALTHHEQIRQARISIFGEHGVHTLNSYYACGVALHRLGRLDEAEYVRA
jgi:tetratricopeptide (TPR) repeat protein